MGHTHDKTLINRLGFSDPDKALVRHDMACRYVARPDLLRELFNVSQDGKYSTAVEKIIAKGRGQYLQHVGFVDAYALIHHNFRTVEESSVGNRQTYDTRDTIEAIIEVKISPVAISDIIRQLNLYREYVKNIVEDVRSHTFDWYSSDPVAVAVLDFDISESDKLSLLNANIAPVRLGRGFETWLNEQNRTHATLRGI